jgi:hypothetical protein
MNFSRNARTSVMIANGTTATARIVCVKRIVKYTGRIQPRPLNGTEPTR